LVVADHSGVFFDQVFFDSDVAAMSRGERFNGIGTCNFGFDPEFVQRLCHRATVRFDAQKFPDSAHPQRDRRAAGALTARDHQGPVDRAPRELENQLRQPRRRTRLQIGVDPALKAVARVAGELQLPGGLAGGHRVEPRDLQQHVRRRRAHARTLAAHDARDALRVVRVGHHQHRRVQRVRLAVERHQLLVRTRVSHHHPALAQLRQIKHVTGLAQFEHDVVGDVDQVIDRAKPDRLEAIDHPLRRRRDLHAADHAGGKNEAAGGVFDIDACGGGL